MTAADKAQMSRALDHERFRALWRRCLLDGAVDDNAAVYQQLIDAYAEPQRIYHRLEHIEHCLTMFDAVRLRLQNPDAVQLAVWFHDMIYLPGAPDNEQLSADHFMALTGGVFGDSLRNTVYEHIMATLHNGSETSSHDTKYLIDIDLSSFGMPWLDCKRDSDNVRREMGDSSDSVFYPKHAAFLKALLDHSRFFQSEYFFEKYEAQARRNLIDYLEIIREKLDGD